MKIHMNEVDHTVLAQAFLDARTFTVFRPEPIADETLMKLQSLVQLAPTANNCQPARYVFVKSVEAKEKLIACVAPGNQPKVRSAAVTVIVAMDTRFYEHLPTQFPPNPDLAKGFESNPANAETVALRNSSLQGAYLILAARLLGLDCGPMSGFDAAAVNKAFFPDGRNRANFLINLGHGDRSALRPRGPRLDFATVATIA